jgi:TM2 domain-containing membrane protein YozV
MASAGNNGGVTSSAVCAQCGGPLGSCRCRRPRRAWLAALLGLVPGLGHLYLGQVVRGVTLLGSAGLLEVLGTDLDLSMIGAALGVPMELGGVGLVAYSVLDAYRTARRLNQG